MAVQTFIGGVEVTDVVLGGTSTHRLNKIWDGSFRIPIDRAIEGIGRKGKIVIDGVIDLHGFITQQSADDGGEGDGTCEYTIQDPREMWLMRPARNGPATSDPGNYILPTFFEEIGNGPGIIQDILTQSIDDFDPAKGDGTLFIDLVNSSFATGGPDMTDPGPCDWPMTIEEIVALLISTGQVDVILTPIDDGVNMARVDVFNGNYGTDRSGTVKIEYAIGQYNAERFRRVKDMSTLANKIRYLLAPKIDDYRYKRSIERTNTDFPFDWSLVADCIDDSRVIYGVRSDIQIHDSFADAESAAVPLYQWLWAAESGFRCQPRDLVHITPVKTSDADLLPTGVTPIQYGDFDIGDLVAVNAGPDFMGGFTGKQRVYERTVNWDEEGVLEMGEIISSEAGV